MATQLARVLGLALAYWGAAKLFGVLAAAPGFAVPMWPSAGIALAASYTWGLRVWPGILIGSFLFNLETIIAAQNVVVIGPALAIPLGIAAGATLQGVLGALFVRRLVGESSGLEDPGEIVRFLVAGGPVTCLVNASLSVALLVGSGVIPVHEIAVNWLTWWAGDTMGVLIFAPLFLTVFGKPEHAWKPRRNKVTIPLVVCLAAITALIGALQHWEAKQLQVELAHDANALARGLTREFKHHLMINKTVASLYAAYPEMSGSGARKFLQDVVQQTGAQAVSWVPRVTRPGREVYEQEARSEGLPDYQIRELSVDGRLVRAGERAEYFPVRTVEPRERNARALGFDLASDKASEPALRSARDSGMQVVTSPMRVVQDEGSQKGLLLLTPVYTNVNPQSTPEQRRATLHGFVSTAFYVANVVDDAFRGISERQFHFRLFDRGPSGEKTLMYSSPGAEKYADGKNTTTYIREIEFGGRSWAAELVPSTAYLARQSVVESWYRYALLLASLLVVSLVGTVLLIFTGRERHLSLITSAVARVGRGERPVRFPILARGPLRRLEEGVNEMAARIEESQEQLEHRVDQATADLRKKKEESEAATLAKSRFLAYASHDLRQPLHALELFVSHLKQLPLNYETAKIVGNVDSCVQGLGELLDGLLDLSRLDSGLVQPAPQAVRVSELWEWLHRAFAEAAAAKHLELRFRPSPLWVVTDVQLLQRILLNLVSNAIRYTTTGGVLVACRRAGKHARLEVWDTGAGIPPEHREEIFKDFVQLENSERDRSKGLGLGLAIVERTARLLGHRLSVRSVPGRGSCFSLDVPITDAVTLAAAPAAAPSPADSFNFAHFTVLVVEDDFLARRALADLLRSWHCIVVEADTAGDAQRLLAGGCRPDVIASDFRLPNLQSGIDLVTRARATLGNDVAAFIISGDTHVDVMAAAKAAGLPLLHKPVQGARLRTVLHLLLESSRATQG